MFSFNSVFTGSAYSIRVRSFVGAVADDGDDGNDSDDGHTNE